MIRILAAMIVGLAAAMPVIPVASATTPVLNDGIEDYWVGYVTRRGYQYHDGYWWKDGTSYTRAKVYSTTPTYYWSNGCRYSYFDYDVVYTAVSTPAKARDYNALHAQLLGIIGENQKAEAALQKTALEHASFTQSLEAAVSAKLLRPIQAQAIAYPFTNHYGDLFQGGYGNVFGGYGGMPTGNTLYTYSQVKDLYGDTNLNVLYQQAARLGQQSQANAAQATSEFNGLVGQAGNAVAAIGEIQAKAQALLALSQAIKPEAKAKITTSGTIVVPPAPPALPTPPLPFVMPKAEDALPDVPLADLFQQDGCAKCHTGAQAKGTFTLEKLQGADNAGLAVVWDRLVSADPSKVMPKDDAGKGHQLSSQRLGQWLKEMSKLKK